MITEIQSQVLLHTLQHMQKNTILIVSGKGDEALYYLAQGGSVLDSDSLIVYLHETSYLLDKVRLFGSINVLVSTESLDAFTGELRLLPLKNMGSDGKKALQLRILEPVRLDLPVGVPLIPQT